MATVAHPRSELSGFRDRREAGRLLALELESVEAVESGEAIVVVGLARGGVEVADEVAARLHAPLEALAVRKVGHPWHPEYGLGAVAPGGVHYVRARDGLTDAEVAEAVRAADEKAARLDAGLHERCTPISVTGRTCVLVDDGLATGGTMIASVRWARASGARRIVVAVPVGAASSVRRIETEPGVACVVCLSVPRDLGAVGLWYEDFHQLSDHDVRAMLHASRDREPVTSTTQIPMGGVRLAADLRIPVRPIGWVVFAHGSGSSRSSPRNVRVATELNRLGMATLLFDLLSRDEELDRRNVFDIDLLARRLAAATRWLAARPECGPLPIAYFGASTGAAAALLAAAALGDQIAAVVSRGGRPDLAGEALRDVQVPTLLIVGGADTTVLALNRAAAEELPGPTELAVVPGATHLFEEPGALDQVASLAAGWLAERLVAAAQAAPAPR